MVCSWDSPGIEFDSATEIRSLLNIKAWGSAAVVKSGERGRSRGNSNRRVTLKDVAKRAGVTTAAVSMALKNNPRIGEATRKRIAKIAEELGYRVDPNVASLMRYLRSNRRPEFAETIGFVYAYGDAEEFKQAIALEGLFRGAVDFADRQGYKIEPFWLREEGMTQARMNSVLVSRNIRGLILPPLPENHAKLKFDWNRLAVISHALSLDEPEIDNITSHQYYSVRLAFEKCRELGYRRIGLALNRVHSDRTEHRWLAGYLSSSRLLPAEEQVPEYLGPPNREFLNWYRDNQPDAIIVAKMHFREALDESGIQVPEDVAMAFLNLARHTDDDSRSSYAVPLEFLDTGYHDAYTAPGEMAGVVHNFYEMGQMSASQIIAALQQNVFGVPKFAKNTQVKGSWVDGRCVPKRKSRKTKA